VLTPGSLMETILGLSSLSRAGQARPDILWAPDCILWGHMLKDDLRGACRHEDIAPESCFCLKGGVAKQNAGTLNVRRLS